MFKSIQIGDRSFTLYRDEDADGITLYYLMLPYGENGNMNGGFLADSEGNLIDPNDNNVIVSLETLREYLADGVYNEWKPNGFLVRKIVDFEEEG
jgi:hypothetical protein